MNRVLQVQGFEERIVPAVSIDSAYETYAWVLVNTLRQNPTDFANNLQGLVNGTVNSAFGFARSDPVIADLKAMINNASVPANYAASLGLMRATPAAGPLAWDELLEDRAGTHNDWMKANGFAHTGTTGTRSAIPGFSVNNTAPADTWGYPAGRYTSWGEDIGWAVGSARNTKTGYSSGAFGLAGLQEREAFLDTAAYMLELNSGSLGHLKNLLGRDAGTSATLPSFNAIGMDEDLYEAPSQYEVHDGVPEAWVSTHRLGLYRPNGTGGFIAGVVYDDANGNGYYDAGEGSSVVVDVRDASGNGFTNTLTATQHGAFAEYVANGTYTLTISANGQALGTQTVTVNDSNAWAELNATVPDPKPTLNGPTGPQAALRPTVSWNSVTGATGYEVRVDDLTVHLTNIFHNAPASGTSWAPPADLVSGRAYRVWVRATFNGNPGPWSDAKDFSVAKATPSAPTGPVANLRPTLSWIAIAGATAYEVRVRDVSANRFNIFPAVRVTDTNWTPPSDLVSGRNYRFTVRAVNAANLGIWSAAASFRVDRPTPSGPSGDVNNVRPAFGWSDITGAASYQVRVTDLTTGKVVYLESVGGTTWSPANDLITGHHYRWRVRAVNASGLGAWSAAMDFRVV
ncbi:MAG TPA: hypothetical protein VKE40_26790 [Gemmataceae bacterium]|nr:hypothetical protein [Gemmataceae bacterium]